MLVREMTLGDIVSIDNDTYSHAIVKQITNEWVTLFRPYVHTADFSYTGGVMCYVGIEEYKVHIDSTMPYRLIKKGKELK